MPSSTTNWQGEIVRPYGHAAIGTSSSVCTNSDAPLALHRVAAVDCFLARGGGGGGSGATTLNTFSFLLLQWPATPAVVLGIWISGPGILIPFHSTQLSPNLRAVTVANPPPPPPPEPRLGSSPSWPEISRESRRFTTIRIITQECSVGQIGASEWTVGGRRGKTVVIKITAPVLKLGINRGPGPRNRTRAVHSPPASAHVAAGLQYWKIT